MGGGGGGGINMPHIRTQCKAIKYNGLRDYKQVTQKLIIYFNTSGAHIKDFHRYCNDFGYDVLEI